MLHTLVGAAARLCEADMAQILRPRDAGYYVAASRGFSPEYIEAHKTLTFPPGRGSLTGRVLLERNPVQIPDVLADPEYTRPEAIKELARLAVKARSESARIAAAKELLDRGYGKARQPLVEECEDRENVDHDIRVEFVLPPQRLPDP
jgi:hypothetical protein